MSKRTIEIDWLFLLLIIGVICSAAVQIAESHAKANAKCKCSDVQPSEQVEVAE